jgi:hypothetical protein
MHDTAAEGSAAVLRSARIRALTARIAHAQRSGAVAPTGWNADEVAPLHAATRAAADFCVQIYTDPDWRTFPWWRRLINAVSWRPFLALERQFFVKPRLIHERLLASLWQTAHTSSEMKRRIDRQAVRIDELSDRVASLEALVRSGAAPASVAAHRPGGNPAERGARAAS